MRHKGNSRQDASKESNKEQHRFSTQEHLLDELIPGEALVPGFDPGIWGFTCWEAMGLFTAAIGNVSNGKDMNTLLTMMWVFLGCLTRVLPCEPCRTSYTNLYWRNRASITHTLTDLAAMVQFEGPSTVEAKLIQMVQMSTLTISYDLQAVVSAKIAGQRGESLDTHIRRRYPGRAESLRRVRAHNDVTSSNVSFTDLFMMMALQMDTDASPRVTWIRYVAFLRLLRAFSIAASYIPTRTTLARSIHAALREHAEEESSCCRFDREHQAHTCAKALAWAIRAKIDPSEPSPVSYATRIASGRGKATSWWESYVSGMADDDSIDEKDEKEDKNLDDTMDETKEETEKVEVKKKTEDEDGRDGVVDAEEEFAKVEAAGNGRQAKTEKSVFDILAEASSSDGGNHSFRKAVSRTTLDDLL